ncbi:MAG: response regulator [Leptolyngbyaceae cyanobacterium RU_5_1]|nr:response regulator [Leptolyngbyaceae cyanobacterium RU_5_1]
MKVQPNNRPKILVVDDEPDNLDLLYRTFYREFKVLRAESGPSALEILSKEGDVAVIISDQRMPLMSGTEFLSLTASQYPDIIRIILTGYTDVEDLVEAINSGKVFKYVTKPWDDEELKAVVRQAVDTHNVLKARTRELRRSLRQESLLNAVTSAIRSALNYRQILQTIGQTVGHIFEVSYCQVCSIQDGRIGEDAYLYVGGQDDDVFNILISLAEPSAVDGSISIGLPSTMTSRVPDALKRALIRTVWQTQDIQTIHDVEADDRLQGDAPDIVQRRQAYQE